MLMLLSASTDSSIFSETLLIACRVAQKVIAGVYPGVTTTELDVRSIYLFH
jgi:hypothetical protein